MNKFECIFNKMMQQKYYTADELIYDTKVGEFLSPFEYSKFLEYKDDLVKKDGKNAIKLDLKSFNNYELHYFLCNDFEVIKHQYLKTIVDDYFRTKSIISIRHADEITRSRIYSEVEGTLKIENIQTTRKAIEEITNGKRALTNKNDIIIHNMINAIEFVNTLPEFNKENLYKLYNILSKDCLDKEDKLLKGNYYRHDEVEVANYKGCPANKIDECMNSLFSFVNNNLTNHSNYFLYDLPHIVHYYIVYIHPYFDYNGRTARMVSYWIALLSNGRVMPPIVSEAINQTKSGYYYSLSETRDSHNDLTYFLIYIYDISIKYMLTYINVENIEEILSENNQSLTLLEKTYLKKILISHKNMFSYQDFIKWIGVDMSKQGALKILNSFERKNILKSSLSKSNKKMFYINKNIIKYKTY